MNYRLFVPALIGLLVILGLLIVASYQRDQSFEALQQVKRQRDVFCQRIHWDLRALVRTPKGQPDVRARIVYHHLDQGVLQLCLGNSSIVDASQAEAEWIKTGNEAGYLDVAQQLLDQYRKSAPEEK